jgi:hypothetical protein
MNRYRFGCVARFIDDLDLAGLDHEEVKISVAGFEEFLAGTVSREGRPRASRQLGDLRFPERGKGDGTQIVFGHGNFLRK